MSATATPTQVKPRNVEVGAYVRVDGLEGEVQKNDKKGGRLTILDAEGGVCHVKYRDVIGGVEVVEGDGPVDPAALAMEADADAAHATLEGAAKRFPTNQELEAERVAATAAKKARGGGPKPGASRKYPEAITDAVRRAKQARGTSNGAPGAKQHVYTRQLVERVLGRKPEAIADLLDAIDPDRLKSEAKTKQQWKIVVELASSKAPKAELILLRDLAKQATDPFCKGRNLASILVAWGEQLQVAADVAKVREAK